LIFVHFAEAIDTESPTGRAIWQMIGILAELERSMIVERTGEGMKAARKRGIRPGPKNKLNAQQIEHPLELRSQGKHPDKIAALLNCSRATVYRAFG
jgi:DNA invertase Pin-like site-specific DNA recombinase